VNRCKNFQEMISAYLDNELDHASLAALNTHLLSCENCRNTLVELNQIQDSTKLLCVEPPSNLHSSIMNRIEGQKIAKKRKGGRLRFSYFTAAAAAVVLMVGVSAAVQSGSLQKYEKAEADNLILSESFSNSSQSDGGTVSYDQSVLQDSISEDSANAAEKEHFLSGIISNIFDNGKDDASSETTPALSAGSTADAPDSAPADSIPETDNESDPKQLQEPLFSENEFSNTDPESSNTNPDTEDFKAVPQIPDAVEIIVLNTTSIPDSLTAFESEASAEYTIIRVPESQVQDIIHLLSDQILETYDNRSCADSADEPIYAFLIPVSE